MNVFEMKCLIPKVWVTRWDRIRNEEIRRRAGIEERLAEKVDRRVLRWFSHVKRMDEGRWPRKVKVATVEGQQERGRPRFGWLEWVKWASAVRKKGLQDEMQLARERSLQRKLVSVRLF